MFISGFFFFPKIFLISDVILTPEVSFYLRTCFLSLKYNFIRRCFLSLKYRFIRSYLWSLKSHLLQQATFDLCPYLHLRIYYFLKLIFILGVTSIFLWLALSELFYISEVILTFKVCHCLWSCYYLQVIFTLWSYLLSDYLWICFLSLMCIFIWSHFWWLKSHSIFEVTFISEFALSGIRFHLRVFFSPKLLFISKGTFIFWS